MLNKLIHLLFIAFIGISCSTKQEAVQQDPNSFFSSQNTKKLTIGTDKRNTTENADKILPEQKAGSGIEDKRFGGKEDLAAQILGLDKNAKIEFANFDDFITKTDTIFKNQGDAFEINYTTTCLNDRKVVQEVLILDKENPRKVYRISHNYQTNISIKKNGQMIIEKSIRKDFFESEVDKDFLNKSILKHPDLINFNKDNNEIILSFMVGVPSTDWLVIAKVTVNQNGDIRLDKIENVSL